MGTRSSTPPHAAFSSPASTHVDNSRHIRLKPTIKMRSFTALASAALVAVSSANLMKRDDGACMTQAEAQQVADNFQTLIADYDATVAENALTADFHDYSDSVFLRWNADDLQPEPVTGIIVGECVQNPDPSASQPWLISSLYSEFNSGAWLVDVGTFVPSNCSSSARRSL